MIQESRPSDVRRLAALDVGTNSIRLIVAEAKPDGVYRLLDDEKEMTRLGRGLSSCGVLTRAAMETSVQAIARMKQIAQGYDVDVVRAVATAAVRSAANRNEFLAMVRERAGVHLDVISPHEEARLAFLSVSHAFDLRGTTTAVVDIGGGSTEVVLSAGGVVQSVHSVPMGAVTLTELFSLGERISDKTLKRVRSHLKKMLKQHLDKPTLVPQFIIGTGGTFTTLAAMAIAHDRDERKGDDRPVSVRGFEMHRSDVKHYFETLRGMDAKGRLRVPGVSAERADILAAGILIAERVMKLLSANTLRIHDRGIRDGLLLSMMGQIFPTAAGAGDQHATQLDRMASVRRFAATCNYERAHSEHVAMLAMSVFDQLEHTMAKGLEDVKRDDLRDMLHAAAVLHDVGYAINYSKHHKHSYHLIIHSDLPGFTHRQLAVIANVARYHRRAAPKMRHENFRNLPAKDREIVRRLSAILRIVDGLDRSHAQAVTKLEVRLRKGAAWFIATAENEPSVDLWGAARKSELFHEAFNLEARIEWAGPTHARQDAAQPEPAHVDA
ncbi:MAG TPA: Ppx/GppA phosphatase family protein [Phycisphaerales bacterium]|nr:Ppx/GppA phosphatase family protein [Phycisphaerales bacterium]